MGVFCSRCFYMIYKSMWNGPDIQIWILEILIFVFKFHLSLTAFLISTLIIYQYNFVEIALQIYTNQENSLDYHLANPSLQEKQVTREGHKFYKPDIYAECRNSEQSVEHCLD